MNAEQIARALGGRWNGTEGRARCPVPGHGRGRGDRSPSLSIGDGERGLVVHCHAGCSQDAVIAELRDRGLWADGNRQGEGRWHIPSGEAATPQHEGCTLEGYAARKRLRLEFLSALGLSEITYLGAPAVRIPYIDENGAETAVRFRVGLDKGGERFRWKTGATPSLYGLHRIGLARERGQVTLCEGESDVHTLLHHGEPALGVPGSCNWREDRDAPKLAGLDTVYVVEEPDAGGDCLLAVLSKSDVRERLRVIRLGDFKDPSGLYLDDPTRFPERWVAAKAEAIPWLAIEAEGIVAARREAFERGRSIVSAENLLDLLESALSDMGLVGEMSAAKLVYLAVTSRLLPRPVSVVMKGPSSGGKSFVVERVLRLFPSSASYALTAMSEKALAYGEEPLSHRMLVLYETAGLRGDVASYLVRSLLSEGRVRYETVEKTKNGLRPRLIEREGPTGLIVTTTAVGLHPENETRMLSVTITDTQEQTRDVLLALARDPEDPDPPAPDAWLALQEWLATGSCAVTVPFALPLARLVAPVAVRLRRDFGALLRFIEAHALLHQETRPRDARGRVVATLADYDAVRGLVAPLIAGVVGASVSAPIRETVATVREFATDAGVSITLLAKVLSLDKATVSRRVRVAMAEGYLRNLETRRGQPAMVVIGEPLPVEMEILPTSEQVAKALSRCSVAGETEGVEAPLSPDEILL